MELRLRLGQNQAKRGADFGRLKFQRAANLARQSLAKRQPQPDAPAR